MTQGLSLRERVHQPVGKNVVSLGDELARHILKLPRALIIGELAGWGYFPLELDPVHCHFRWAGFSMVGKSGGPVSVHGK